MIETIINSDFDKLIELEGKEITHNYVGGSETLKALMLVEEEESLNRANNIRNMIFVAANKAGNIDEDSTFQIDGEEYYVLDLPNQSVNGVLEIKITKDRVL